VYTATTAPHALPGAPVAICRAFAAGFWQGSIALQLATIGAAEAVDLPTRAC
jgi:hypothetical protein